MSDDPKRWPTMTPKEFNAFWAKRQHAATVRIIVVALVALALMAVALVWVDARRSTWTLCERGVECSATRCRCVR